MKSKTLAVPSQADFLVASAKQWTCWLSHLFGFGEPVFAGWQVFEEDYQAIVALGWNKAISEPGWFFPRGIFEAVPEHHVVCVFSRSFRFEQFVIRNIEWQTPEPTWGGRAYTFSMTKGDDEYGYHSLATWSALPDEVELMGTRARTNLFHLLKAWRLGQVDGVPEEMVEPYWDDSLAVKLGFDQTCVMRLRPFVGGAPGIGDTKVHGLSLTGTYHLGCSKFLFIVRQVPPDVSLMMDNVTFLHGCSGRRDFTFTLEPTGRWQFQWYD